jgi:hypothetical protein
MNEIKSYAVVDASGAIINSVLWDGSSDWMPPKGCTAIQSDTMQIGGTYIDGVYTAPEVQEL